MVVSLFATTIVLAQTTSKPSRAKFEYAVVKWDGPDRIQIFYPDKLERFRVSEVARLTDCVEIAARLGKVECEPGVSICASRLADAYGRPHRAFENLGDCGNRIGLNFGGTGLSGTGLVLIDDGRPILHAECRLCGYAGPFDTDGTDWDGAW